MSFINIMLDKIKIRSLTKILKLLYIKSKKKIYDLNVKMMRIQYFIIFFNLTHLGIKVCLNGKKCSISQL